MSFFSAREYMLWALGVLAHLVCLAGIVFSLRSSNRVVSLRFALIGLATVLTMSLLAWWFYESGLTFTDEGMALASVPKRGEVKMAGIYASQKSLTVCLYLGILPLLVSIGLLVRGLTLDPEPGTPGCAWRPVLAVICLVAGAGLLGMAMLDYLNFGPFLHSILLWVT